MWQVHWDELQLIDMTQAPLMHAQKSLKQKVSGRGRSIVCGRSIWVDPLGSGCGRSIG